MRRSVRRRLTSLSLPFLLALASCIGGDGGPGGPGGDPVAPLYGVQQDDDDFAPDDDDSALIDDDDSALVDDDDSGE